MKKSSTSSCRAAGLLFSRTVSPGPLVYLRRADLLEWPRSGVYRLSDTGGARLPNLPPRIDVQYLQQSGWLIDPSGTTADLGSQNGPQVTSSPATLTPDEQIRLGYKSLRTNLAAELLERIRRAPPRFFEQLVVDLLVRMGYGGSHEDAAQVIGGPSDGDIDGIIKEDRLGLESIYIQAKRWKDQRTVGSPDIEQFAGALQGRQARKGVFITTSRFTEQARRYADTLPTKIVLVDGALLAELMIDYGVAVTEVQTIRLVQIDEDYFGES